MSLSNRISWWLVVTGIFLIAGCTDGERGTDTSGSDTTAAVETDNHEAEILRLPELEAAELNGELLKVIATTSIIGNVVSQVGGEAIDLTTLIGPGQDPHGYESSTQDLRAVADADVIFINGWNLEEGLVQDLREIGEGVPLVPISAGISPLTFGEAEHEAEHEEEHLHSGVDPHVWFDIQNVMQWVENTATVLSSLDPANSGIYESNAAAYLVELEDLEAYVETQLGQIPADDRIFVTNHDSFSYFVQAYDFELIGTIIPAASTLAEPSAGELAGLIEKMEEAGLCTIFTETTVSDSLAQTVAGELAGCDEVKVVKLYSGALGLEGSGADSYIGMFRANVDAIVAGLN